MAGRVLAGRLILCLMVGRILPVRFVLARGDGSRSSNMVFSDSIAQRIFIVSLTSSEPYDELFAELAGIVTLSGPSPCATVAMLSRLGLSISPHFHTPLLGRDKKVQ
eukprot:Hpha_TRINITY_DN11012_c0_g1::TRINITY_DN11012_c0_g1_i1::g.92877::m.92877